MDEPCSPNLLPGESQDSGPSLESERRRAREVLRAQRSHLVAVERKLRDDIEGMARDLANEQTESAARRADIERQAAAVARLKEDLDQSEREWRQAQDLANRRQRTLTAQLAKRQEELDARERALEAAEALGREARRTLSLAQEEAAADKSELVRKSHRLDERLTQLEREQHQLAAAQEDLRAQRQRIAEELKRRRAEQLEEIENRRLHLQELASMRHSELEGRLAAGGDAHEQLARRTTELETKLAARERELAARTEQVGELQQELDGLRSGHDKLSQELAVKESLDVRDSEDLAQLQADREMLLERLAKAEAQLTKAAPTDLKDHDLQRRLEMAMEDLRDLKRQNAELAAKLAQGGGKESGSGPSAKAGGKLDWEAQKKRLLASLEADFDANDPECLAMEDVIRSTNAIVAAKDEEIAELKQMLDEQSSNLGSVAVGAAAIAGILDQDELIQQERENLRRLQAEWQEKQRKAEIDLSMERAKVARERAELEEKLLTLKKQREDDEPAVDDAGGDAKGVKPRGRWLARLGLKEE